MVRKQLFVKPGLQLKYLMSTLFIVLVTSVLVYFTLVDTLFRNPLLYQLSMSEIRKLSLEYTRNFVHCVIVLFIVIGLLHLVFFHRVAGPIYVFEKVIKMISDGYLLKDFKLRKTDELKGLANEIQCMCDKLREFVMEDRRKIGEIGTLLDNLTLKATQLTEDKDLLRIKELLSSLTQSFKV